MHRIRLFSSFLTVAFFLAGCGTTSIIQQMTTPPEILAMIQPVRTLKIFVAYDNPEDIELIKRSLGEASTVLKKQIGVELQISSPPVFVNWRDGRLSFNELEKLADRYDATFDIAIGFGQQLPWQPRAGSLAMNEDTYRRFIVSTSTHPWILAHEIGHSFVLCHVHSTSGLMQADGPMFMEVLDYTFTKKDREEALRNKWRKFGNRIEYENCIEP